MLPHEKTNNVDVSQEDSDQPMYQLSKAHPAISHCSHLLLKM